MTHRMANARIRYIPDHAKLSVAGQIIGAILYVIPRKLRKYL